ALRFFAVEPGWLAGVSESLQYHAGWELHDPWLIGKGTLGHRLDNLRILPVLQTLLAAGLWYAILVLQSAPRPWRWALPLLPIVAGIISIWPTLWVDAWQETALKMTEEAPFPDDLWFWIMGVGLREEGCKLALFALFLPWLLRRRAPGLALMTGAFVGLGFALEENLGYYEERGGAVALGRFLTANFFHAALSGIAAHALYDMLRSRFARADKFLLTFLAVVVVHGLYDYAIASGIDGMGYLTMAMLAFTAWHFLDLVAREGPGARQWVAPAAVLLIGTALLIASVFWFSAIQVRTKEGLYAAALECVGVLPVLFIYWRRLN
ncbi:MAG TPA: PrsW family glutamic-type intramembrane protease, partial [Prosthecobacter sp.]|nr:PrsW family glutamic-type intramembrane protease [Prosthecobacter sp.]